jgi:LPS sulfotransferase NodH
MVRANRGRAVLNESQARRRPRRARWRDPMRMARRLLRQVPLIGRRRIRRRRVHAAMFHVGRCGSTVLARMLDAQPQLDWDGEIYQGIFARRERPDRSLPPITDVDAVDFLVHRAGGSAAPCYGFEVKHFHLRALATEVGDFLARADARLPNLRYIVLERRNTLRVVVSTLIARATDVWHVRPGFSAPRIRVCVDPGSVFVNRISTPLVELLEEFDRDQQRLTTLLPRERTLHIAYEDDIAADPTIGYRRVCAFLGLEPREPRVELARTNAVPLPELVENMAELRAALEGTRFAWMVDAD